MGLFKQQYLSWMLISVAAACVTCQELTSTLRDRSHACRGEEVIFNCTIRGSTDVPDLILAWSSTEYIGEGIALRFTTEDPPGTTMTSVINGNATATITSNTNINGVPTLVSELRIIADRASTMTCRSVTTSSTSSTVLNVSAVPAAPQDVGATAILLSLSENDCEILVNWNPPDNSLDILHYIVYIPSLNLDATTDSFILSLLLRDCPESFGVKVAAINRFDCIGINSSELYVQLHVTPQSTSGASTSPAASESSQFSAGAIAGIAIGSIICFFLAILVIGAFPCGLLRRIWRNKDIHVMPGEDDTHELVAKAESVDYIWELQMRASLQAKESYQKQSKHSIDELGIEKDRVSVPIWIDDILDDGWRNSLHKAVKAINEAAPGLSLSIMNNKERAIIHVLAIQASKPNKKEPHTKGNILKRSISGQADYITTIYLGKSEDDAKKGITTRELFHALGFHQDNNLGLTHFDPLSITLYQSEKAYESARRKHPGDLIWWLKTVNDPKLSELDKVYLNLIYPPCRGVRYTPKLGKTGMYYCGRPVMSDDTYPGDHDKYIDGICGPNHGPNCPACRTITSPKVEEVLTRQKWQGMTGRVYCGRYFTKPTERHNGVCGMNNGPACPECVDLLNKEI